MKFIKTNTKICPNHFETVISLGNKCPTAIILKELDIYKESYPFDYIPTTPKLILKYMQDQKEFYPEKNIVRTKDDVWFGHFNIDDEYEKTLETFRRRFQRFFTALEEKKRILFVYTSEADVYNEMGNRYNDNYSNLVKISEYIQTKYNYSDFLILAVHTNKEFEDTDTIKNVTIHVDEKYLSDAMETHIPSVTDLYRRVLKFFLAKILI